MIDLVPAGENEAAARARADRREWLKEHDYRVIEVKGSDVERDVAKVLDGLAASAL